MQVSYRGGSPLYFWPNYSLASRANPRRRIATSPATGYRETTLLSLFFRLHLFCLFLLLSFSLSLGFSMYLHGVSLSRYLPSVAAKRLVFFFFFSRTTRRFPLFPFISSLRFLRSAFPMSRALFLPLSPSLSSPCSLSTGVGTNREPSTCCEIYTVTVHRNNDRSLRILARPICVIVRDFFHPATKIYFAK